MGEEPEVDEVVFTRCGVGADGGGGVGMGLLSSSKESTERGEDGWEEEDEEEADGGEAETCYGAGLGELVTFFCCCCSSGILFGGDVDWKGGIVSLMLVECDLFVFSFLHFSFQDRRGEKNLPSSPIYVVL